MGDSSTVGAERSADDGAGVSPREQLAIVMSGADHVILASPRLFVSITDGTPTMAGSRADANWARRGMSKSPRSVGCVVVLGPSTTPPPADVRGEIPKLLLEIVPGVAGLAMVIEGDGFRVAALRAVFTGFLLLRRLPYEASVFGSVRDALGWIGPKVGVDPADAAQQIEALRRSQAAVTSG